MPNLVPNLVPIHRALLSVSDKTGIVALATELARRGVELVSTGGTAKALTEAGLGVIPVERVTGSPEMMDGRVKTLHPKIHGALLARRDVDGDVEAMQTHGITPIDLVCVNLYPFARTVARPDVTTAQAIEQIDIGGPSMVRSAAKNHAAVTIVTSPADYGELLTELNAHAGATTLEFRRRLANAAFRHTADYDSMIWAWLAGDVASPLPALGASRKLRYGENPHQAAAVYAVPGYAGASVATAQVLHGKPLSYNNLQDAAAGLELVQDLAMYPPGGAGRVAAAILKHTNPCGAASADTPTDAFDRAYDGDPLAAYGGILAISAELDAAAAARICDGQKFLEVIVAPSFSDDAVRQLGERWKNVRLLAVGDLAPAEPGERTYRSIPGGVLVQERDTAPARPEAWEHAAGPAPDAARLADAVFAWTVVKHLKSNAIAIAAGEQLLGAGCGSVDRVAAAHQAIKKAGNRIAGSVAASDAFFPFADGPQALIDAGVTCLVHPGGSKRDAETFKVCNHNGVTCLLTGVRHFRH